MSYPNPSDLNSSSSSSAPRPSGATISSWQRYPSAQYQGQHHGHHSGQQHQSYNQTYYAQPQSNQQHNNNYDVDPSQHHDEAAQIAQWQSAYSTKDETATTKFTPLGPRPPIDVGKFDTIPELGAATVVAGADGKQQTVVRSGGGKTWQDRSLLEWDPTHPRLFVGNLAGEVTDDSLFKAFQEYPTVQKARVIRDKRTSKSKGYGFVSFSSSDDYFQAAKEMQGKYIGSHPISIKRSTTEIKAVVPGQSKSKYNNHKQQQQQQQQHHNQHITASNSKDRTGAGIQKKQPKKKGGLKLLG